MFNNSVYAIGFKKGYISGFGELDINYQANCCYGVPYGLASKNAFVYDGWIITCPGGKATWTGDYGRMLYQITPYYSSNCVRISSKDHLFRDAGQTAAYIMMARMKP